MVDEITVDGKKIARMALEYIYGLGHKKIGYIGPCSGETRYHEYLNFLRDHDLDLLPKYIIETSMTQSEGYKAMSRFVKMKDRPTAIYCTNDITAIGALRYLSSTGNRYYQPSVISSDDIEAAQLCSPMLTTVRLPKDEMGSFAVKLLLDRLNGGHKSIIRMEFECRLMITALIFP